MIYTTANFSCHCKLAWDNRRYANWYVNAEIQLREVASREQWDATRFASILACTSPRVAVKRNVRIALQYLATGEYLGNVMAPIRASVAHYETTGEIRGLKIRPFRDALLGDEDAIVLDVHMAGLFGIEQSKLANKRINASVCDYVRQIADRVGLSPRDCQAALWAGRVASIGRDRVSFPILSEYRSFVAYGRQFPNTGVITNSHTALLF